MVTLCWVQQVAAIFKIGNSKDIPQIPESLSNDAKSFIKLCLQRDPPARPTASELLNHPFIRDQATTRVGNMNVTKDAFPTCLMKAYSSERHSCFGRNERVERERERNCVMYREERRRKRKALKKKL